MIHTRETATCSQCGWVPDRARRMSVWNQAEEHCTDAGHVVVFRITPMRGSEHDNQEQAD